MTPTYITPSSSTHIFWLPSSTTILRKKSSVLCRENVSCFFFSGVLTFKADWIYTFSLPMLTTKSISYCDLYYKKFPTKRRYFSLWQSKQLKHSYRQWKRASVITNFIWWSWSLYWRDQFVFVYEPSHWRYHLMWNFSIPNIQNLHFL